MHRYRLWVRLTQTSSTFVFISAESDYAARLQGEAIYGKHNLISFTRLS